MPDATVKTRKPSKKQPGKKQDIVRRLPVGAEMQPAGGVAFRVWAPIRKRVEIVFESGDALELTPESDGYFSGYARTAGAGARYHVRLDGEEQLYPDPSSRFQPEGPHGPSEVIDPDTYTWNDHAWKGVDLKGQVIYELHIGTFTPEGTWAAAMEMLPLLAETGITVIEMMPVAEFPGRFGWGYDGVDLFAPTRLYGRPDNLRAFVDRAHQLELAVILDVVYNHFGPDGAYHKCFSEAYFTDRYKNDWGEAINFDGEQAGPVRDFFIANAGYWIDEFHFDGLRLDATQDINDISEPHILQEITKRVRIAAGKKKTIVIAENEPQKVRLVRPFESGGYGMDGLWNDDFHHSAVVALTGRNPAYYEDHHGAPQEFISSVKWGYLFQGQWYKHQAQGRGTSGLDLHPVHFINFLENHDQVANSGRGQRINQLTDPGRYRAMTALHLLAPGTPMLFQGQEFASSRPFYYFADHKENLAPLVKNGREEFLAQFPELATPEMQSLIVPPHETETFEHCKLDWSERKTHPGPTALHRDLLRLRREDPAFSAQRFRGVDGAVLGPEAFALRYFNDAGDRLVIVNLGRDLYLTPIPEPLLAPPENQHWEILWSSEDPTYGGNGTTPLDTTTHWLAPGHTTLVLYPVATPIP